MRTVKLMVLMTMALFAIAAAGATAASAEEIPEILCLVAKCVTGLEGTFKGTESKLETLTALPIEAKETETTIKGCTPLTTAEEKDFNLCKDIPITFKGAKSKGASCKTEGDEKEVLKVLLDLHLAAEETSAKVLEPLLLAKVLNNKLEALPIGISCGVLKEEVKGTVGCLLLPGLTNIAAAGAVELTCKINATTHDPETGKCELQCTTLTETPFEAKIGEKFEDAWENITLKGSFNKDIFIDD